MREDPMVALSLAHLPAPAHVHRWHFNGICLVNRPRTVSLSSATP